MADTQRAILIIMAKQPSIGAVKTRLCPPLTYEQAGALYNVFLLDTINMVHATCKLAPNITPALAYAPSHAYDYFRALVPNHFHLLPQIGANLGERLSSLPVQARQMGFKHAAMISSDSPTLPPHIVVRCFEELARPSVDVALGPCYDGGYYLIGLDAPQPALFRGITWSTASVTQQTLRAAEVAGLQVSMLPTWYDADTADDLYVMWADLEADPGRAPLTHAVLSTLLFTPATTSHT